MNDSVETKLQHFYGLLHNFANRLGITITISKDVRDRRIMTESKEGARLKKFLEELDEDLKQLLTVCSDLFKMRILRVGPEDRLHRQSRIVSSFSRRLG